MGAANQFRHYLIVQDAEGSNVELARTPEQVAVLAYDTRRLEFVHCHVLLEPLKDRNAFSESCERLRKGGHPLLARMVEFGEDEGNGFYITSNVDGETLRAYLARQQEIPVWLAVMIACRALETGLVLCDRGDLMTEQPLESLRIVQTGPHMVQVQAGDFRLLETGVSRATKGKVLKANFERQTKFLKTFLLEQSGGGPTMPESPLPAGDFGELLGGCLTAMSAGLSTQVREFRDALQKLSPEHLSGEIPTAQKPRALLAPLLASYQEVARGVVNLVRIQSQRLDMANPYSMRGTLTRSGRLVMVEQIPPARVSTGTVQESDRQVLKLAKKREYSALVPIVLVNEVDGVTCMAEEIIEGVCLADLLRERRALDPQEAYLVLAGLDAALMQIEKAGLPTKKIRTEDVYLLTGFAKEDSRTPKLMAARLNEWPTFSVMVRAHPSIAAMAGRGTDPAALLPVNTLDGKTPWTAGWMAAMGRVLIGLEESKAANANAEREREGVIRLLDEELQKVRDGLLTSRADFLARLAKVVQHYDQVKPVPVPVGDTEALAAAPRNNGGKNKSIGTKLPRKKNEPPPPAEAPRESAPLPVPVQVFGGALVSGAPATEEKAEIGFAEILFQKPGGDAEEEEDAHAVGGTAWNPDSDSAPLWLKAAVFIGGSMVMGGLFAHLTGDAFWLKMGPPPKPPTAAVTIPANTLPPAPSTISATKAAPKAIPITEPAAKSASTKKSAPAVSTVTPPPPVKVPDLPLPPEPAGTTPAMTLKPPQGSGLRSLITDQKEPTPPPAPVTKVDGVPVRAAIPVPD